MHNRISSTMVGVTALLVIIAGLAAPQARAGDLTPPGGPDDSVSRMKTLQQVYERAKNGLVTTADPARPFADPAQFPAGGTGTMANLSAVYNTLPYPDDVNGALMSDVCSGKSFWGLNRTGNQWGFNPADPVPPQPQSPWSGLRFGSKDCSFPSLAVADRSILERIAVADPGTNILLNNPPTDTAADNGTINAWKVASSNTTVLPPEGVTFSWNAGGYWVMNLKPAVNMNGSATVTVTAIDADGLASSDSFLLTVTPVNSPPTAQDDSYTINRGGVLTVAAPGVLGNDTDPDGPVKTVSPASCSGLTHGVLTIAANGGFTYTNDGGVATTDSCTYRVSDGDLTDTGTLTFSISSMNATPSALLDDPTRNASRTCSTVGTGVAIAPQAGVTDGNDTSLESMTVVLSGGQGGDGLTVGSGGPAGSIWWLYSAATSTLRLGGHETLANYETTLGRVRFTATNCSTGNSRTVTVTVNDGDADSVAAVATVTE